MYSCVDAVIVPLVVAAALVVAVAGCVWLASGAVAPVSVALPGVSEALAVVALMAVTSVASVIVA